MATSSVQFFRSIGGAVAVAALGALFNARLAATGAFSGGVDPNAVLEPALRAALTPERVTALQAALLYGLQGVYGGVVAIAAVALGVALLVPRGRVATFAHAEAGGPGGLA